MTKLLQKAFVIIGNLSIILLISMSAITLNFTLLNLNLFQIPRELAILTFIFVFPLISIYYMFRIKIIKSIYFITPIILFGFILANKYEFTTKLLYLIYYLYRADYDSCERLAQRYEGQIHIAVCHVWSHKTDAVDQAIIYDDTDQVGLREGLQSIDWIDTAKKLPGSDLPFGFNEFNSYLIKKHFYNVYFNLREYSVFYLPKK